MANSTNPAPSSAPLGTHSGSGSISTTKAGVLGYILGLATAGILYIVTNGKGKRSDSAPANTQGDNSQLPPAAEPVDVDAHDVDDDAAAEEPVDNHALSQAGQKKLTDEDVAQIRMMKDGGMSVKEIAALYDVSPKTVYARIRKQMKNPKNLKKDGREE